MIYRTTGELHGVRAEGAGVDRALDSGATQMISPNDPLIAPTWVAAVAACAAGLFAIVQFAREVWRERVRVDKERQRIERIAYELYRQLRSWLGKITIRDGELAATELEDWLVRQQNSGGIGQHLDRAEQRMADLMDLRADARPRGGRALDRAYVYFLEGTRRLNEYISTSRPTDSRESYNWRRLLTDAQADLSDCVSELQHNVIWGLIAAERELRAKREEDDPLNQFVDAWMDEIDSRKRVSPGDGGEAPRPP
jgi:hypothetical protein